LREFILLSRSGRTDANWSSLHEAGRLDIVHECIVSALFLSHGLRKDAVFHVVLNGPPNPPRHVTIDGQRLHDVRTDQQTWTTILRKILSGKTHPGIATDRTGFETLVKGKSESCQILVLEEDGIPLPQVEFTGDPLFILGDHVGLPQIAEKFALRYGEKVSLGKTPYLAAHCITILNHHLDNRERC